MQHRNIGGTAASGAKRVNDWNRAGGQIVMSIVGSPEQLPLAHKRSLSRRQRLFRLIVSVLDPRAILHLFKIINYYNYTHVQPKRKMRIGNNVALSPDVVFSNPERIEIGDGARIGSRCHLWAGPSKGRVVIGANALFGPEVLITAAGYRYDDGTPVSEQPMDEADVVVGRDVWLGAKVIVLAGVVIGDGAIVGAGAVVTKSLPPGAVAIGVPARIVRHRRPVYPGAVRQDLSTTGETTDEAP